MINSQLFEVRGSHMQRVGYLNQRLLFGNNIKEATSTTPVMIAQSLNEMVRYCPWAACSIPFAMGRFDLSWFGRFRPNWYVPVHLGGIGLNRSIGPVEL
jgi:hypothetical protein